MIKNIFAPDKIGSYYIFPKRIIGFDIGKTHVSAAQVLFKGKTSTIEKTVEIPLEAGNSINYDERVIKALQTILEQVDSYDAIYTSISSSLAIFKELKLPFTDSNKIRMVIDFEVEPLLPFAVSDAVIDFIITKKNYDEKSSEILVAALQKQHLAHHLSLFAQAGVDPHLVTLDLFALYGIYQAIPTYASLQGGTVLIDLGAYTTSIAYIYNGQLRLIRSLSQGILTQAKAISVLLNVQASEAMETIMRFGLEKNSSSEYTEAANTVFTDFWQEISFTLNSFSSGSGELNQRITKIIMVGGGSQVKGLPSFVTNNLGITCEQFQWSSLPQNNTIGVVSKNGISATTLLSVSTALSGTTLPGFTMRRKDFTISSDKNLLTKQLISAGILSLSILVALGLYDFFQLKKLNNAAYAAEQEALDALKQQFKSIAADEENLETAVQQARAEVQREQKLWFAFANPARVSFLEYLLELSTTINKEELGFVIDSLHITENSITMTAHVRDYDALKALEMALKKSKLLRHFDPNNTPDFTMKIRI